MITQEQRTTILAIYAGAHERISRILSHFPIVKSDGFETSVFLFAFSCIAFGKETMDVTDTIGGELKLYSFEQKGDEDIRKRIKLYGLAADGRILPCGFWSPIGIDTLYGRPETRIAAMFGDILVDEDCVNNYGCCEWPMLRPKAIAVFSTIFTTRVIPEMYRYMRAIKEVLSDQAEEK